MDGRPPGVTWNYDRAELVADAIVHGLGIAFATIGSVVLIAQSIETTRSSELAAVLIYVAGLVAVLGLSAAYDTWPVSRRTPGRWSADKITIAFERFKTPSFVLVASQRLREGSGRALVLTGWGGLGSGKRVPAGFSSGIAPNG